MLPEGKSLVGHERIWGGFFREEQDSLQDFYEPLLKVNLYHSTEFTQVQEERPHIPPLDHRAYDIYCYNFW